MHLSYHKSTEERGVIFSVNGLGTTSFTQILGVASFIKIQAMERLWGFFFANVIWNDTKCLLCNDVYYLGLSCPGGVIEGSKVLLLFACRFRIWRPNMDCKIANWNVLLCLVCFLGCWRPPRYDHTKIGKIYMLCSFLSFNFRVRMNVSLKFVVRSAFTSQHMWNARVNSKERNIYDTYKFPSQNIHTNFAFY